jgi:hypothetical protein
MSFNKIGCTVTERHGAPTPTDAISISVTVTPIEIIFSLFVRTQQL